MIKHLILLKTQNIKDIKEVMLKWIRNFLIKDPLRIKINLLQAVVLKIKLAEELHKMVIRKFEKLKVYSSSKDNSWGAGLADIDLISKFNKGIGFLLCVIDIFRKYAQAVFC